mmetsp:Transcript_10959/g.34602  ORF Transcript_10959/g.34602 Transcript_10959/m.34602 type:complete len:302 (-) Transcript_10959:708-1613(-)
MGVHICSRSRAAERPGTSAPASSWSRPTRCAERSLRSLWFWLCDTTRTARSAWSSISRRRCRASSPLARKHLESAPVADPFTATLQTLEQALLESAFGVRPRNPHSARHLLRGGPVATGGGLYLHSGVPAEGSHEACYRAALRGSGGDSGEEGESAAGSEVLPGVHFLSSTAFVRCALADPQGPQLRLFLGHSGWGARQLDGEWRAGAWRLCGATAAAVFASDVSRLWDEMTSGELGVSPRCRGARQAVVHTSSHRGRPTCTHPHATHEWLLAPTPDTLCHRTYHHWVRSAGRTDHSSRGR